MITLIELSETERWKIVSTHTRDSRGVPAEYPKLNLFRIQRATLCTLYDFDGIEYRGVSYCSHKDIWDPELGHRQSLEEALASLDRKVRTKIWAEYNKQHPPKKIASRCLRHGKR